MIQEFITQCDKCKDIKVTKVDIWPETDIWKMRGKKLYYKCIVCCCDYCSIVEPYFDDEEESHNAL